MNIIRSDKNGRHIHSPFVYRLVANVLFAPYPFYSFSEIDTMVSNKIEAEELKLIFRLVNFFRFDEVHCDGYAGEFLGEIIRMAKPGLFLINQEAISEQPDNKEQSGYKRLIILNNREEEYIVGWFPVNPEVWIVRGLENSKQASFFLKLKSHQKVKITLELNHLGIVIFNENFEKQNYVIKY